ncbi:MAG: nicotinamide riboside transporter PnuC [Candidatus Gastranaerophilales bacterium]|nr:nicotinamide riboside transporter PnuC [Candidatus Gastranaerophilales bacterium]
MTIKNFIKYELKGWNKIEIIGLSCAFFTIFINSVFFNDNIIAVISALCGILYTIIAGKGKISCYLFGIIGTACYSYLAYKNSLYGNFLLNALYYLPMEIIGILAWKNKLNKTTHEIIKTHLKPIEKIYLTIITTILCIGFILVLKHTGDNSPYIDGITTILSILGMYLTVKRCIEQWMIWIIVNTLSIIMWLNLVLHGTKTLSTVVMWSVYLILGIYFYIKWKKELSE